MHQQIFRFHGPLPGLPDMFDPLRQNPDILRQFTHPNERKHRRQLLKFHGQLTQTPLGRTNGFAQAGHIASGCRARAGTFFQNRRLKFEHIQIVPNVVDELSQE